MRLARALAFGQSNPVRLAGVVRARFCLAPLLADVDSPESRLVLVVEDDELTRAFLLDNLIADGFRVAGASGVGEALRAIEVRQPGLVVLDLGLEDGSGLALLDRVRAADGLASRIDPDLPVIVLAETETRTACVSAYAPRLLDYAWPDRAPRGLLRRASPSSWGDSLARICAPRSPSSIADPVTPVDEVHDIPQDARQRVRYTRVAPMLLPRVMRASTPPSRSRPQWTKCQGCACSRPSFTALLLLEDSGRVRGVEGPLSPSRPRRRDERRAMRPVAAGECAS